MQEQTRAPLSQCFYHFGDLIVPPGTPDPWADPSQKCLVTHIRGRGQIAALCFRTDYHGVWFGFEVDDYPLVVCHNGHCLSNMGLIGAAGAAMPFYLPYFNGPEDLAIACRLPIEFHESIKLWMGNSHSEEAKKCIGLHVYVTGMDIEPAEGNLLAWTVTVPARHPHTKVSGSTIVLERYGG